MRNRETKIFKVLSGGDYAEVDTGEVNEDGEAITRNEYVPEFEELTYSCDMLDAVTAQKTLIELLTVLGQPILMAIAKGFGDAEDIEGVAEAGLQSLFLKLTPEKSHELIQTLLGCVRCEGVDPLTKPAVFKKHFAGNIYHLYRVIAWSIEVNFRDFFVAAHSFPMFESIARAVGQAATLKTTIPSSGDSSAMEKQ